jgi:hypothetical protein
MKYDQGVSLSSRYRHGITIPIIVDVNPAGKFENWSFPS